MAKLWVLVLLVAVYTTTAAPVVTSGDLNGSVSRKACPEYGSIKQSSVNGSSFSVSELGGVWYLVATTEPTIPPFCKCNVLIFTIDIFEGLYDYQAISTYANHTITIDITGELSDDPANPGNLREHARILNHTVGPLLPNMFFNATRNAHGDIEFMQSYACLGNVLWHSLFSFMLLSRSPTPDPARVASLVAASADLGLHTDGVRIATFADWQACGLETGQQLEHNPQSAESIEKTTPP